MDSITLGQIKDIAVWIGAFATAIGVLYKIVMKGFSKATEPMEKKLDTIQDDLNNEKKKRLKTDLTTFMYLAENNTISDEQKLLANEEYDEYIQMGGNSYIKNKYDKLMKEGKI